jgi:hypothetical protein
LISDGDADMMTLDAGDVYLAGEYVYLKMSWVWSVLREINVRKNNLATYYIRYLNLYYYQWVDTSAGGPEGIIWPGVSVSALTWGVDISAGGPEGIIWPGVSVSALTWWVDTSAGGPEGIIWPGVSVSALTCFIWYIFYWNLQFLNKVTTVFYGR